MLATILTLGLNTAGVLASTLNGEHLLSALVGAAIDSKEAYNSTVLINKAVSAINANRAVVKLRLDSWL